MKTTELGRMVYSLRTEKYISQEDLCRGICSVATLYRLESGERRPDILTFQAICQRLGRASDNIGIVLTLEEFEYFVKRRNIEISMTLKEYERAEEELKKLEQEEERNSLKKQDIHRQFALLYLLWQEDYKKAKEHVLQALVATVPDFDEDITKFRERLLRKLWMSDTETKLLMMYAYLQEEVGLGGKELLECVWDYIRVKVTDQEEKEKRVGQVRYFLAQIRQKNGQWRECYEECEAVIHSEVKCGFVGLLFPALSMEMNCLEHGAVHPEQELRKKQYLILEEVIQEYGEKETQKFPLSLIRNDFREKQLIDELLRDTRMRKKVSQEKLSEGICAPETLSRIETGKRNPTVKHFYELMQKLGLEIGYYNTYFDVERFETLEKGRELQRLIVLGKFAEAEKKLQEIEQEIDGRKIRNQQYLAFNRAVLERELHHGNLEKMFQNVEQALELTLEKEDERFRVYYQPTQIEISLLNQLAILYRSMGKPQKAVEILRSLYDYYHRGKLKGADRDRKYFMVLSNLASCMEEIDELDQAMEYAEEAIRESLRLGIGVRVGRNLITMAYIKERMEKKICLTMYEQAYYLCELFEDFRNQKIIVEYVGKEIRREK
ncbi:MAG: helix-turn-helix transcriptional regulator [Lachnospiraceae bacterium]|nr:helix-turn-helix transcriptional regulator [Lachnospiraceae bacterium]